MPGTGPGQFSLPHNIAVDSRGRVFVADRESQRVQIFDQDGGFIEEWADDVRSPGDFFMRGEVVFLVEQGSPTGITIYDLDGSIVTRWRGAENGTEAPHGIWLDSKGNIFVAEIGQPGHGQRMRKYVKV
jgi:sugar lactone lactonase YvrE